ncbi:MAG: iron ABC transporter [Candidatus Reconcilbacillus cellulovorans]|uniref:Iron ABC transporter n=1 Tax=Candidatus Reconcilbacillus cellulovorans TaxID=1906605 RepID=A0A2A6DXR2_9BACL|nr:MAG: iron ABC transporter [Candidatus Reconcilbacillus cellulovorans]
MSDLIILLTGGLVAASCSLLGSFLVLRRMAMVGDAISHAVLPGIAAAFLASGSRDPIVVLPGAALMGVLAVFCIQWLRQSGVQEDAATGVVFTALFAAGVLMVSLFARHIDLDLEHVLYGEIVFVPYDELHLFGKWLGPRALWFVGATFALNAAVVAIFYKQFKLCSFDPLLAASLGVPVTFFHYLLMALVSLTTVAAFDSVGAVLVVGMLVLPPATAYLLTDSLARMIGLGMAIGVADAAIGYGVSVALDASTAGCMVTVAGLALALAFLFSPKHGILMRPKIKRA